VKARAARAARPTRCGGEQGASSWACAQPCRFYRRRYRERPRPANKMEPTSGIRAVRVVLAMAELAPAIARPAPPTSRPVPAQSRDRQGAVISQAARRPRSPSRPSPSPSPSPRTSTDTFTGTNGSPGRRGRSRNPAAVSVRNGPVDAPRSGAYLPTRFAVNRHSVRCSPLDPGSLRGGPREDPGPVQARR
jgi:hypothetical protein